MPTLSLDLPPELSPDEARILLAIKSWETGRLTLGQAAALAGYTKRTFMELLGKHGVPVFNYPSDDLAAEACL